LAGTAVPAELEKSGRIVIPAELRRQLGLIPGEDVLVSADENSVIIRGNRVAAVRRLQEKYADLATGRSLADELVADRRAAAEEGSEGILLDSSAFVSVGRHWHIRIRNSE
jgi:AbrB family looped-hinge helix DNA binding protein